ncbi:MAG: glycosyltransferase family 4 protein [Kiritimatiellales bacterium]|nr:glycosyltransferase family 4 protein [Kiritimatiellales bacterium]
MNVLLVHNYYPVIGGGEDSVVDEERAMLEQAGHKVVPFFIYTKERGLRDFAMSALCLIWNPAAFRRLRLTLQSERPDVVHCHNTFPLLSPSIYWACRKEGVPVVQTLHNYRLVCANGLFLRNGSVCEECSGKTFPWPAIRYRCYRESYIGSILLVMMQWVHRLLGTWRNKVDRYIALTEFAKSRFVDSGVLPAEKVSVKPNFINDPCTSESAEPKKNQAVFIGRLWPEKGCHVLVEAWVEAFKRSPGLNGCELLIIGDGPGREKSEALCSGRPADYAIQFLGTIPRAEVLETLKASRFLVLPSIWYEGFPMTIVEAFACGVPVLSAKLGSMLSIIEEQKTGLFFEAGNIDQLVEKLVWAVSHEADMDRMGKNARVEFEKQYSTQHNCEQLLEIYQKA